MEQPKRPKDKANNKRNSNGNLEPLGFDNILHDEWKEYNKGSYGDNSNSSLKPFTNPDGSKRKPNPDKGKHAP